MKPTVWHLCSNRWNSAITEYALRSTEALARRGWSSSISALAGSPCETRAKELGLAGPSYTFSPAELLDLKRRARVIKPNFIITYGGPETFLARFLGCPVVRFRGQDSDMAKPLSGLQLWGSLGFTRAILTPAATLRQRFQEALPKKRIESITLGLDTSVFRYQETTPPDRPKLLIVGRFDPVKGHARFFEIFQRLLAAWNGSLPKPYLEIIGQSANVSSNDLREAAKALGLSEGVDWGLVEARVQNLPERMSQATLGVVPSIGSEVICRVAEEFLLCGTPVLVSGVGALEECLRQENFGSSLKGVKDGAAHLKVQLERAFGESSVEKKNRAAAAAQYFSLERMGEELEAFLSSLTRY